MALTPARRRARRQVLAAALRERTRTHRAAARARRDTVRAARRVQNGPRSLATHAIAAGLERAQASGCASGLRTAAQRLGIRGTAARIRRTSTGHTRRAVTVWRYSRDEVALMAAAYRPRRPDYRAAAARLAVAA
ncbi:hypothetical protein ACIOUE_07100 [Streptomyces xanthochromogenes]|uniref:hypothetical protein n=1 Tax=Streptomyces xanthochromogenes TaxID=67384 RepID=UPI003426FCFB